MKTNFETEWVNIQKPLAEALRFPGCEIKIYTLANDRKAGCYLEFRHNEHVAHIDFEDAKSAEELDCVEVSWFRIDERGEMQFVAYEEYDNWDDVLAFCETLKHNPVIPPKIEE